MPKRKASKPRAPRSKQASSLKAIYAESRKNFTAADLQKYTVIEKGFPLEGVIAKMEAIQYGRKAKKA